MQTKSARNVDWEWGLGMGIAKGDWEWEVGMGIGNGNWECELGVRMGIGNGNWEWELGMEQCLHPPCFRSFRPPPTGFRYQVAKGQAVKTQAAKEGKSFTIPVKDFTGVWSVQHEDNEEAEPEEVQASGYALPFIRGGKGVARTQ